MTRTIQICFNCKRSEDVIPLLVWTHKRQELPVCAACMPIVIHNWEEIVTRLETGRLGENDG